MTWAPSTSSSYLESVGIPAGQIVCTYTVTGYDCSGNPDAYSFQVTVNSVPLSIEDLEVVDDTVCTTDTTYIDSALATAFPVNVTSYLTQTYGIPASAVGYNGSQATVDGVALSITNLEDISGTLCTTSTSNVDSALAAAFPVGVTSELESLGVLASQITCSGGQYSVCGIALAINNLVTISGTVHTNSASNVSSALSSAFSVGVVSYLESLNIPSSIITYANSQFSVNGVALSINNLVTISGAVYTNSTTNINNALNSAFSVNVESYLEQVGIPACQIVYTPGTTTYVCGSETYTAGQVTVNGVALIHHQPGRRQQRSLHHQHQQRRQRPRQPPSPSTSTATWSRYGIPASLIGYSGGQVTVNGVALSIANLEDISGTLYTTSTTNIASAQRQRLHRQP